MTRPIAGHERSLDFSSCRHGVGPLTWAQKSMWKNIQRIAPHDEHLNLVVSQPIVPGVPLTQAMNAVRTLVSRHDALRTTYPTDASGEPVQRVVSSGQIPARISLIDIGLEDQLARLGAEISSQRFDTRVDLPLRVTMVVDRDAVCHILLCLTHMAVDSWSLGILRHELTTLLSRQPADGTGGLEPPTRQPLEQARYEREVLAKQTEGDTIDYWHRLLARCPTTETFRRQHDPATPRFWGGTYRSDAVTSAAAIIADRHRVSDTSVLLAAASRALSTYSDGNLLPLWIRVSNRLEPDVGRSVLYLSQNSPVLIDVTVEPFTDLLRQVHIAAMRAYTRARYDPDKTERLLDLANGQRSSPIDLTSTFNAPQQTPATRRRRYTADTAALRAAAKASSLSWEQGVDNERIKTFINAFSGGMNMIADTECLRPLDIEATLRRIEEVLVAEATRQ